MRYFESTLSVKCELVSKIRAKSCVSPDITSTSSLFFADPWPLHWHCSTMLRSVIRYLLIIHCLQNANIYCEVQTWHRHDEHGEYKFCNYFRLRAHNSGPSCDTSVSTRSSCFVQRWCDLSERSGDCHRDHHHDTDTGSHHPLLCLGHWQRLKHL